MFVITDGYAFASWSTHYEWHFTLDRDGASVALFDTIEEAEETIAECFSPVTEYVNLFARHVEE